MRGYTTHKDGKSTRLVRGTITKSNSTVTIGGLKAGDVVLSCWVEVTTAFNAGTTNVLTVGTAGVDNKFLGASDVTEGTPGVYPTGGKGPFAAETAAGAVIAKFVQTGTAATTGSAVVYAQILAA